MPEENPDNREFDVIFPGSHKSGPLGPIVFKWSIMNYTFMLYRFWTYIFLSSHPSSHDPTSTSLCYRPHSSLLSPTWQPAPPAAPLRASASRPCTGQVHQGLGAWMLAPSPVLWRVPYHPILCRWAQQITLFVWWTHLQHPWCPRGSKDTINRSLARMMDEGTVQKISDKVVTPGSGSTPAKYTVI